MSFNPSNFTAAANLSGDRRHKYTTTDTRSTIESSGYFNDIWEDVQADNVLWTRSTYSEMPGVAVYAEYVIYHVAENDVRIERRGAATEIAIP